MLNYQVVSVFLMINPKAVKYPPESLIEAFSTISVGTGVTTLSNYLVDPWFTTLEKLAVDPRGDADITLAADGYAEKAKIRNNAIMPNFGHGYPLKIFGSGRIAVLAQSRLGAALPNFYCRYNLTFRKPYAVDKLWYNADLTAEEVDIATNQLGYDLSAYTYSGLLTPKRKGLLSASIQDDFLEIVPVFRSLTPVANSTIALNAGNLIGQSISPSYLSQVGVLLGIIIDHENMFTALPNDTYITVIRDDDQAYMQLDVTACPRNVMMPCYVPFTTKLEVYLESVTGSQGASLGIGFVYGIRDLTILDHMRWNLGYSSLKEQADAESLINTLKLWPNAKAGVVG
jgi:hypothetical protein